MKLVTFTKAGDDRLRVGALVDGDDVLDLSAVAGIPQPTNHLDWFDMSGATFAAVTEAVTKAAALDAARIPSSSVTLRAPIPRPGKVICIGLNYRDHAEESGMDLPEVPVSFSKFSTSVCGPNDNVVIPHGSVESDYEAELLVVIGRRAKHVAEADAMDHVLGYACFNDVSARDFQFKDGQWQRGKSPDTFGPMGPFIATKDEIADPHRLSIKLRLNDETMQDSSTEQLVFGIPALVSFLSQSITLEPGDVIATGTPPGVGFARKPPVYIKSGDVMEVEIEGLGVLRNPVTSAD